MEQHGQLIPTQNMGIIIGILTKTNINTKIKHLFIINETVNQARSLRHGGDHSPSSSSSKLLSVLALALI